MIVFVLLCIIGMNVGFGQSNAQNKKGFRELSIEVIRYPAGYINTFRVLKQLTPSTGLTIKIGYNAAKRMDFGEHDDEKGGGPGFGLGYRYYLNGAKMEGFFLSGRVDVWFMNIDWQENRNGTVESGDTFISVLQPTFAGGYQYLIKDKWPIELGVAFGIEWNVISSGEDVGQGGISQIFASIGRRF